MYVCVFASVCVSMCSTSAVRIKAMQDATITTPTTTKIKKHYTTCENSLEISIFNLKFLFSQYFVCCFHSISLFEEHVLHIELPRLRPPIAQIGTQKTTLKLNANLNGNSHCEGKCCSVTLKWKNSSQ